MIDLLNRKTNSMYPPELTAPMKADLVNAGFEDLSTPEQVDALLQGQEGTVFLVVNSVCGCAAANARPAAKLAAKTASHKPSHLATVFAGVDIGAVARARGYMLPYPPSSPSMALFKNGVLVHFVERHQIEGASAESIANGLAAAFETHCG